MRAGGGGEEGICFVVINPARTVTKLSRDRLGISAWPTVVFRRDPLRGCHRLLVVADGSHGKETHGQVVFTREVVKRGNVEDGSRGEKTRRMVIITGFERFNSALYTNALRMVPKRLENVEVLFFTDEDVGRRETRLEEALSNADVLLVSLVFDHDQVKWLLSRSKTIPVRFVFESALELMQVTQVGEFTMDGTPKTPSGLSKVVVNLLGKFGLERKEEDKLAGYLQMLKMGPKLLRLMPGRKMKGVRDWLTVYAYWNAGSADNIAAMLWYIAKEILGMQLVDNGLSIPEPKPIATKGVIHPAKREVFENPREYLEWYDRWFPERKMWPRVGLLLYRKHVISNVTYVDKLILGMETGGIVPVPFFINGVEAHIIVRDYFTSTSEMEARKRGVKKCSLKENEAVRVDAVVSTIGFPLVGGPAGSMEAGRKIEVARQILTTKNVPYIVAAPLITQDIESWTSSGVAGLQSVVLYVLPELDGAIDTVPLGGLVGEEIELIDDRISRLTGRLKKWIALKKKPRKRVKVAVVLYGYPPNVGASGTAALLNVPKSLRKVLTELKDQGYDVGDILDMDAEQLIREVRDSDDVYHVTKKQHRSIGDILSVSHVEADDWIGVGNADKIDRKWGRGKGALNVIKSTAESYLVGGVRRGNIWIGCQPPVGVPGDPMRLLFEKETTPHPQYAAFYRWIENGFGADICIHFGMHGTVEWLPGPSLGNNQQSWPDILLGNMPNLYIYAANNPSESSIAKRRGYGVIISHNIPPYARAGLYNELAVLKGLIHDYRETKVEKRPTVYDDIRANADKTGLTAQLTLTEDADTCIAQLEQYLQVLESRLFSSGLHVLGESPEKPQLAEYIRPLLGPLGDDETVLNSVCLDDVLDLSRLGYEDEETRATICEAREARDRLLLCREELTGLLNGMKGGFVEPAPGGDVIRDGKDVLPTGKNIFALDPYRLPSRSAFASGVLLAEEYIQQHRDANGGQFPETIAVPLWGLDNIKTKGESVAIVLGLVGATLTMDATGRNVSFDLIPLSELQRPRVDVLASMSGIFRDCFEHVVHLLDDMFRCAAVADEPEEMNFIKKHTVAMKVKTGMDDDASQSRVFSNPAGDFGSLVTEMVITGSWDDGDDLGKTWKSRNMYAYGRNHKGTKQKEVLEALLGTTTGLLQEIDSVEYGLTDIQEYYANSGALLNAAKTETRRRDPASTKVPTASFVEAFTSKSGTSKGRIQHLSDLLNLEYRSKLLNPKWSESMLQNGSGGAYEVSQRFTALLGWAGTTNFGEEYVFAQAAERYVMNSDVSAQLQSANPEAYRNILTRLLEAHGRGIWKSPDPEVLKRLKQEYEDIDAMVEGV